MSGRERAAVWLGLTAHVLVGALLYMPSGLLAPLWAVGLLWFWWTLLLFTALRLRHERRLLVAGIPFIAAGTWFLVMTLGDLLLGWTA